MRKLKSEREIDFSADALVADFDLFSINRVASYVIFEDQCSTTGLE